MPSKPLRTFYVATLSRYVLVNCKTEEEARKTGFECLRQMYADVRHPNAGSLDAASVLVVRPATDAETDLWGFHLRMTGDGGVRRR